MFLIILKLHINIIKKLNNYYIYGQKGVKYNKKYMENKPQCNFQSKHNCKSVSVFHKLYKKEYDYIGMDKILTKKSVSVCSLHRRSVKKYVLDDTTPNKLFKCEVCNTADNIIGSCCLNCVDHYA